MWNELANSGKVDELLFERFSPIGNRVLLYYMTRFQRMANDKNPQSTFDMFYRRFMQGDYMDR